MVMAREGASLLPTSSCSVKNVKACEVFLKSNTQVRGRRQLGTDQRIIEDEIVVRRSGSTGSETAQDAPLANPDRLWPSGVLEFKFYKTFPEHNKRIVREAMDYIKNKTNEISANCIEFEEATNMTEDYVLIRDGVNVCKSEVGRISGVQNMHLSR